jgi:xanthine dehydrogenase accessory factor
MSLWSAARERIASGMPCALVTVIAVQGSAPREAGASMLVWADGQQGTVGGGALEYRLVQQARAMLAKGDGLAVQEWPLGPLLSQCCGGRVRVLLERLDAARLAFLDAAIAREERGHPYLVETRLSGGALEKTLLEAGEDEAAMAGSSPVTSSITLFDALGRPLDPGARPRDFCIMQAVRSAKPQLLIFGAGHVGQAVARIAATLPLAVQWIDGREELRGTAAAGLKVKTLADPAAAIVRARPHAQYLIFTHSHALDYALTRAVLARGDFRYCGLIGSKTKRARFESRLRADGIAPAIIARLVCPIGAIGLKSKAPEALAVAVAAELLMALEKKPAAAPSRVRHVS